MAYKYFTIFNEYKDGIRTGLTYEERIGEPDVISAGLGHVALGFSFLEDSVNAAIAALLETGPRVASIVVSEISFKAKVHILSSLVHERAASRAFNCGDNDPVEAFKEMVALLFKAEELRNQVMHSSWVHIPDGVDPWRPRMMGRRKSSAKARRGFQIHSETVSGDDLLDIYDFTLNVEYEFAAFFLIEDRIRDQS